MCVVIYVLHCIMCVYIIKSKKERETIATIKEEEEF